MTHKPQFRIVAGLHMGSASFLWLMENLAATKEKQGASKVAVPVRYCLYARKSTESEERQVQSIDSQVKEMLTLAEREGLDVVEIRRERATK